MRIIVTGGFHGHESSSKFAKRVGNRLKEKIRTRHPTAEVIFRSVPRKYTSLSILNSLGRGKDPHPDVQRLFRRIGSDEHATIAHPEKLYDTVKNAAGTWKARLLEGEQGALLYDIHHHEVERPDFAGRRPEEYRFGVQDPAIVRYGTPDAEYDLACFRDPFSTEKRSFLIEAPALFRPRSPASKNTIRRGLRLARDDYNDFYHGRIMDGERTAHAGMVDDGVVERVVDGIIGHASKHF